jgi:SAM-dependent methyltransferase
MKLKPVVYGIATFIPGVNYYFKKGTGGTNSARYCYSVWLRHLVMAKKNGLNPYPQVVAELGPGDSLGIGLAALISGSERYLGFDIVEHANVKRNLKVFDELVALFNNKVDIPGYDEFPDVKPYLDKYNFPSDILNESRLNYAMKKSRLVRIRNSITNTYYRDSLIKYKVPWYDADVIEEESVDMIYSQAVLEHVDDLVNTYRAMYLWLKPNGYISHQIDFRCHGTTDEWNGHWTYSDFMWKLIRGKRSYLLNRETHSKHVEIIENEDFRIECEKRIKSKSNLSTDDLAPRFKSITDDDLTTSGSFIQALK